MKLINTKKYPSGLLPIYENKKQSGSFYTSEVVEILDGFEHYVRDKDVVDPMVGEGHLTDWAVINGSKSVKGYDINPSVNHTTQDTLLNPVDLSGKFVLANPPYLQRSKSDNKEPYDKWNTTDLYKASILAFIHGGAEEGILIVPSNLFYDNAVKFRQKVFDSWHIDKVIEFDRQVFPDTDVRVVAFHFIKGITTSLFGHKLYNTKVGESWYKYLEEGKQAEFDIARLVVDRPHKGHLSNLVIHTTDTGSEGGESKLVWGDELIYSKPCHRNKASISTSIPLSETEQKSIIYLFNEKLSYYRDKYDSRFLTNFLPGKDGMMRKYLSFSLTYQLLKASYQNI